MASLGTLVVNLGANTTALQRGLSQAQSQIAAFGARASRALGSGLKIGAGLATGLGAASLGLIKIAADAERTAISLEVLVGSASTAQTIIAALRANALQSPFNAADLIKSAETMALFGVQADRLVGSVRAISEIAAGDAEKLGRLSVAFGQMSAAGRLMGQDLLQMVNSGFNPLQEISRKTGESMIDLKARMEDGAISSAEVAAAFESATQAGGRFFGMNERMAGTTIGLWQRFTEQLQNTGRILGESMLPTANKMLQWVNSFADEMQDMGAIVGTIITNMDLTWKTMLENVSNYSFTLFEYVVSAGAIAATNLGIHFRNMYMEVHTWMRQLGEEIAFALGLSDEVLQIAAPQAMALQQMPELKAPAAGPAGQALADQIAAALERSRAGRAAQAAAAGIPMAPMPFADMPEDDRRLKKDTGPQAAGAMLRGSAEAFSTIMANVRGDKGTVGAIHKQTNVLGNKLDAVNKNLAQHGSQFVVNDLAGGGP